MNAYSKRVKKTQEKSDCSSQPVQPPKKCPECNSSLMWKDGLRHTKRGVIQRYLCRRCGYRFSESKVKINVTRQFSKTSHSRKNVCNSVIRPSDFAFEEQFDRASLSRGENVTSHGKPPKFTIIAKHIKELPCYNSNRRVCVSDDKMKNLAKVENKNQSRLAGATESTDSRTVTFLWELKKQGFKETTIKTYSRYLLTLTRRGANLLDPETVKETIAKQKWNENTRSLAINAYSKYLEIMGGTWKPPKHRHIRTLPFVPLESELDQLISGANKKTATFLQLLKETAMRCGEAWRLNWTELNIKDLTITLNEPEKYGKARMFKISSTLLAMLQSLPKNTDRMFEGSLSVFRKTFRKYRSRLATKLKNPRFKKITFHTFRHWKASIEYHKTKDILHVMEMLGHRDIKTTLIYTQLVTFEGDEYNSSTAKTTNEAKKLLESGFEYVCTTPQNVMLFRKRK